MTEYNMPQYILREFKVTDARVSISIYHSVVSVLHNMSNCFERFLSVSQATSLLLQLSDNWRQGKLKMSCWNEEQEGSNYLSAVHALGESM